MRLNVIDSLWHRKDDRNDLDRNVTMKPVATTDLHVKRRRSKFASGIAAEEFGWGRYLGWSEWDGFSDLKPPDIEERRVEAWARR